MIFLTVLFTIIFVISCFCVGWNVGAFVGALFDKKSVLKPLALIILFIWTSLLSCHLAILYSRVNVKESKKATYYVVNVGGKDLIFSKDDIKDTIIIQENDGKIREMLEKKD